MMSLAKERLERGQRRSRILRVASYGQTYGSDTTCSVPSSEVTKYDTNTSPRRLVTHLLQQMDQSFTSRRHSGHGSANATRNNISAKDQTTIAKASKASSEYHTMEALCGGPEYTGTVGCRAATYSTSSGTKSGSSSEK
jgi:hypothetical protein